MLYNLFVLLTLATGLHAYYEIDRVVCYFESWTGNFQPEDIDVSICTHINYAFLGIHENGTLRIDSSDDIIRRLVDLKQKNADLKIMLSVGGWGEGSEGFSHVAADPAKKQTLAESAMWYINTYNVDGIDIDWEYPTKRGGTPEDNDNFVNMLWVLRDTFNANGGKLLSVATWYIPDHDVYNIPAISEVVDYICLMTYDIHTVADGKTGQNSPLGPSSTDTEEEKLTTNVIASVNNWIGRGVNYHKLVVGLAFYGHGFELANASLHSVNDPILGEGAYGYVNYNQICQLNWTEVWDEEQSVPYKYTETNWIGFDNPRSIAAKVEYVKNNDLGGVMMWSVNGDDKDGKCGEKNALLNAIRDSSKILKKYKNNN